MSKKDFIYLIIIVGLCSYIIIDRYSNPLPTQALPKETVTTTAETDIDVRKERLETKPQLERKNDPARAVTREETTTPELATVGTNDSRTRPETVDESNNETPDVYDEIRIRSSAEYIAQRAKQFEKAAPDAWGDDMKYALETRFYNNISQPNIKQFEAQCKAQMCNVNLDIEEGSKPQLYLISSKLFPPGSAAEHVRSTISGNTVTIQADFKDLVDTDAN
ncbi:MAG: hypothetical protein ACQEQ8_07050 [Pseudomonadota bacterium]